MKKLLQNLASEIREKAIEDVLGCKEQDFESQYETESGMLIDYKVTCTITEEQGFEEDGYCGSLQIKNLSVECQMLVNANCVNMPNVTSELNYYLSKLKTI